jgi:hypothetical protein
MSLRAIARQSRSPYRAVSFADKNGYEIATLPQSTPHAAPRNDMERKGHVFTP